MHLGEGGATVNITSQLDRRGAALLQAADKMARSALDLLVHFGEPYESPLGKCARSFLEVHGTAAQFQAAEALADEIERWTNRTGQPIVEVLLYRDPDGRPCERCGRPEANFWIRFDHICLKCFLPYIPE